MVRDGTYSTAAQILRNTTYVVPRGNYSHKIFQDLRVAYDGPPSSTFLDYIKHIRLFDVSISPPASVYGAPAAVRCTVALL